MHIPNPVKMFRNIQKNKEIEKNACSIFKERLLYMLLPRNKEEQKVVIAKLKERGITALVIKNLAEAVARDTDAGTSHFRKRELRIIKVHGVKLLSEVVGNNFFSNMVVVIRDIYAEDIATHISCDDAVLIIIETFLGHS